MQTNKIFISMTEACDELNISRPAFYRLVRMNIIRRHKLPTMKYGRYYREDIDRLKREGVDKDPKIETKIRKMMEIHP